jgi:hypothetical protein
MALVSGRPISFKMDLYQPLFIPRPTVEPDLFASLRPPVFSGDMGNVPPGAAVNASINPANGGLGVIGQMGGQANLGQQGGFGGGGFQGVNPYTNTAAPANRYNLMFGQLGQQGGFGGNNLLNNFNFNNDNNNNRLTYDQLQQRQQQMAVARNKAKSLGSALAAVNLKEGVASVASAEDVGDYFQYVIDHKVTLPRQKSALLPILTHDVEATRVSIFNESVQAKFPLLGLKFKNTSGQSLMQGPVTVYEGNTYAGDARVLDLQPGEERLVAYALDQGTEVKAEGESAPQRLTGVKIVKGIIHATHRLRETKTYRIKNRSPQDRVLIVEHPVRPDWHLAEPEKPAERSRDNYRFEVKVPAGQSQTLRVVEEQSRADLVALSSVDDRVVRVFLQSRVAGPKVKEAMEKGVSMRTKLAETQREVELRLAQLKAFADDQARLRANFERLPPTSAAYKRYLEKFDTQETEIEKLQAEIKQLQDTEKQQKKAYEEFLASLTVE